MCACARAYAYAYVSIRVTNKLVVVDDLLHTLIQFFIVYDLFSLFSVLMCVSVSKYNSGLNEKRSPEFIKRNASEDTQQKNS